MKMKKVYEPKSVEKRIYQFWEKSGFFNPDKLPRKRSFSIMLPPPNITGSLHMGHALNAFIQDILIRWKRLDGFKTLWVPGTDHAGIATQVVVEKELKKEGKTRFDLGKEKFLERVWQWVKKYGNIILHQYKRLGCSLDWSRLRFTLDKDYTKAVETAFLHYFKNGLIYKSKRPINWCIRCQTSLSDLEIEYEEREGYLWYIKYPIKGGRPAPYIVIATTRPETMLGDTAVAVNPLDKRYKNFIGKTVILPLLNREIPIVSDRAVNINFGTGAVKITPAHDLLDFEISQRHNLPLIEVINENGKIIDAKELPYRNLSVLEAREKIIEDLEKRNLLERKESYKISIPKCTRCHETLEILPSTQWFLKMQELAKKAKDAVEKERIKIIPSRFKKIYLDWVKNIKDWCISRQIWWGHKIPLRGEDHVLDTWFSSALWPFAALGWPKKTRDLKTFYPTSVLSTARDIINLWVARMVFSGLEFMKEIPFRYVFIHPTILTKEGKRMSKSLGTGIDPMELIEKYGADATRFGLIWQLRKAQDIRFDDSTIKMGRKFCNKIWNASRFVILQLRPREVLNLNQHFKSSRLTIHDRKILKKLETTKKRVTKNLEKFEFGKASETLYHFFWRDFCDVYIERAKSQLVGEKTRRSTINILAFVLLRSLILLHPFAPFITEEIYQKLPIRGKKASIMIENWNFTE